MKPKEFLTSYLNDFSNLVKPNENIIVSRKGESWDQTGGDNVSANLSTDIDIQTKTPRIPRGGIPVPMFGTHFPKQTQLQ